jgi:ABC-type uncharacterized transport system substrate-binding protein
MTTGRNPRQRKEHQYRSLPIQEWPDSDRKAWEKASRPGVRLRPGGSASHFAEASLKDFTSRYGAYLGFLQRSGKLNLKAAVAAAQVTRSNAPKPSTQPIGYGFVESLAHPGGNATGLSLMAVDLSGKRLELLKQAVPNLSRVALLTDPKTDPLRERTIKANQAAAQALGITLWSVDIAGPDDIEPAFAKIAQDHADGVIRGTGSAFFNMRERIGAAAIAYKLPGMTYIAEELPHGLLLSYGQDFPDFFRRAVAYTDKILKGAKPADLPVEQPTKFKLVLNLKTANALGVGFPQSLILSADEMIE